MGSLDGPVKYPYGPVLPSRVLRWASRVLKCPVVSLNGHAQYSSVQYSSVQYSTGARGAKGAKRANMAKGTKGARGTKGTKRTKETKGTKGAKGLDAVVMRS